MLICTMTLECVCKIYPRRWHLNENSYSIHLSQLFRFKLFKLYSNILKCVNLIEIWFYAYFYTPSFLVLWHIMFDTTAQIPEVEFGGQIWIFEGKYSYWLSGQITNTDFCLLLDMQKQTYCNKICDSIGKFTISFREYGDKIKLFLQKYINFKILNIGTISFWVFFVISFNYSN